MFKKVLVLTNGDDPRQPALKRALECVADGGEIAILAVVYEPMLEGYLGNKEIYEPLRRRVLDERREAAAALARAVESHGVHGSAKAVWSHPMHAAVAAEVAAGDVDLVVTAPAALHRGGRASHGGLTHDDWQVVTTCGAPLLMVKSDGAAPYKSIVAAVDPFHSHAKPAALDTTILRVAELVRRRTGATLGAVHCYFPPEYFGGALTHLAPSDPGEAEARLAAVRQLCTDAGVAADAAKVFAGAPHDVLAEMQKRGEADLVVMGALARSRLAELILGNTAERVLHHGTGDVLVVTPPRARAA